MQKIKIKEIYLCMANEISPRQIVQLNRDGYITFLCNKTKRFYAWK